MFTLQQYELKLTQKSIVTRTVVIKSQAGTGDREKSTQQENRSKETIDARGRQYSQ